MKRIITLTVAVLLLLLCTQASAQGTELQAQGTELQQRLNIAFKAAKAEAVFNNGQFVNNKMSIRELAQSIRASEPLKTGVADSVANAAHKKSGKVYLIKQDTRRTHLKMATFNRRGEGVVFVDDNGDVKYQFVDRKDYRDYGPWFSAN